MIKKRKTRSKRDLSKRKKNAFNKKAVELWGRGLMSKLRFTLRSTVEPRNLQYLVKAPGGLDDLSWDLREENAAVYAVQGRRPRMEDRFVVHANMSGSGVSLYAVFDGHGGEFAANYAKDHLIDNLKRKVMELKKLISKGGVGDDKYLSPVKKVPSKTNIPPPAERKPSIKKTSSMMEDAVKTSQITDPYLLDKLESLIRPITREVRPSRQSVSAEPPPELSSYLDSNVSINYGRLLTDEVLAADRLLVEMAKKSRDVAGSTALLALVEGTRLIVANVGDSRGVMCDSKGQAIPLSFDHKPQQSREKKRIEEAGGSVSFNGVWRVAGILATSRALGDYPLKDKKLVIADPDILTFELADYKPQFLILASDGLWDTFSNEEAIAFIKSRLHEPHFGAKSITLQSYYRGSLDNITVIVINLSNHNWN